MDDQHDRDVLSAKSRLTPAMPRSKGTFRCPFCGQEERVDGNCPKDGIPLRRVSSSER